MHSLSVLLCGIYVEAALSECCSRFSHVICHVPWHVMITALITIGPRSTSIMSDMEMGDSEDFDEHNSLRDLSEMARQRILAHSEPQEWDDYSAANFSSSDVQNLDGLSEADHAAVHEEDTHADNDSAEYADGHQEDDDDDDEEVDDELPNQAEGQGYGAFLLRNLMQRQGNEFSDSSLLDVVQRLVGGLEGSTFGRQLTEYDSLVDNLTQREDPYLILETLNELLERLLMMNGITAERVISPNKLAKALVDILRDPVLADDMELHLVACRCLYNFLEVNQDFIHDALNNNAVEVLVLKLLEITYIDLTEQGLQTLEMMSRDQSSHSIIVESNGLKACLQNLDFLTVHAQRKCLIIVANACGNVSTAHFNLVVEVFDKLAEVVETHTDTIVLENAWLAISRIIISFKLKPEYHEKLFLNEGLLTHMAVVIRNSCNPTSTEVSIKYQSSVSLLKSLIILASTSVHVSLMLIDLGIGQFIISSLGKFKKAEDSKLRKASVVIAHDGQQLSDAISIEALIAAPKELLSQFLQLIGYLLPITYTTKDTPFLDDNFRESEAKTKINIERASLYRNDISTKFWEFVNHIWPVLIHSFQASMDYEIRRKVLINMARIVSFCEETDFKRINSLDVLTGILTSVISSGRNRILKEETPIAGDTDLGKLHQHLLLLSAFMISQRIINKSHFACVRSFEREGLFSDAFAILLAIKQNFPHLAEIEEDGQEESELERLQNQRIASMSTSYLNKFVDKEFTKDYEFKLTSEKIYTQLLLVGERIRKLYDHSKSLEDNVNLVLSADLHEVGKTVSDIKKLKHFTYQEWVLLWESLKRSLLSENTNISSFELISLNIIGLLADLFTSEYLDLSSENSLCGRSFMEVFFNDAVAISRFVDLLQESLTRNESFEVITSGSNSPAVGPNHTASMVRQIKIKLIAEDPVHNKIPLNMQTLVLSVHGIATFKSIDAFLKQHLVIQDVVSRGGMEDDAKANEEDTDEDVEITEEKKYSSVFTEFLINGEVLPIETTIYGAVYRALQFEQGSTKVDLKTLWNTLHVVTYRRVASQIQMEPKIQGLNFAESDNESWDPITKSILRLLKVLSDMNQNLINNSRGDNAILTDKFMNWKLTVKLNRQLEEPLVVASGTLPSWSIHLTKDYPFIFPLDTRLFFLQSTSFGYSRLIHNWQSRSSRELVEDSRINANQNYGGSLQLGRALRQKVRISRKHILQSAMKVLLMYGSSPGLLEIEYFDEVGSGLGPTLEFYSTVSKEFCKTSFNLWRNGSNDDNETNEGYISSSTGLFPAPIDRAQISSENGKRVLYLFSVLGKFIARALIDSRIVDFNFNPVFLQIIHMLNTSHKISPKEIRRVATLSTLRLVDPALADSIQYLMRFVECFKEVEQSERDNVEIDGTTIHDLSLYYVLPGYPSYELTPNGSDIAISPENLEQYINKVLEVTIFSGIVNQAKAFMDGFSKVFPISSLVIFSPQELVEIFGNAEEDWSTETLAEAIKANHGFTQDSPAIKRLINILNTFSNLERREFLQFLTGSPKLPIGGFRLIRPEFTVVKKEADDGRGSESYLPSVMTCANYLKLPDYSLEEVMRKKLLHAITEGAGAFHLS